MTEIVNLSPKQREVSLKERQINPLFPSLVFSAVIDDNEFLDEIQKNIIKMTKDPEAGSRAGEVGWFSHHNMHVMDEFSDLYNLILKEMVSVFDYYQIIYESVYLTSMWANVAYRPEYCHQNHIHPNSMFSGVLHINSPKNASKTSFNDPRPAARMFEPSVHELTGINSGVVIPRHADRGQLFIFPSYLPHGVNASHQSFGKGNQRITVSFNAMMTGEITTQTAPLILK